MPISIIIDANLLLLAVVGCASRKYVAKHKRLQCFSLSDFDLLSDILSKASQIIVTPNTLTEVSNLARHIAEPAKTEIAISLRNFLLESTVVDEKCVASAMAASRGEFLQLGLTDSVLLELASMSSHILTIDRDLHSAAMQASLPATNFNHLKEESFF